MSSIPGFVRENVLQRPSQVSQEFGWPGEKRFAFTIVDDTDSATVAKVKPVYDFLAEQGFRTTKTVWPLRAAGRPASGFGSLEHPDYRDWVLDLQEKGFEIAMHGAADEPSVRESVHRALDYFQETLGHGPRMHVNHVGQEELMYWYEDRLHGLARQIYRLANRYKRRDLRSSNQGHVVGSRYFWGDLCRTRIEYVRNLTFTDINTLRQDPIMPYHDPERPFVNFWYSATEGSTRARFCERLSERNQDRLLAEGGACILYTHFAFGFVENGIVDRRTRDLLTRLGRLSGWFVPCSVLLDHLRSRPGWRPVADRAILRRMEMRWIAEKFRHGTK